MLYISLLKTALESEGYALLGFDGSDLDLSDYRQRISSADYLAILALWPRRIQPDYYNLILNSDIHQLVEIAHRFLSFDGAVTNIRSTQRAPRLKRATRNRRKKSLHKALRRKH